MEDDGSDFGFYVRETGRLENVYGQTREEYASSREYPVYIAYKPADIAFEVPLALAYERQTIDAFCDGYVTANQYFVDMLTDELRLNVNVRPIVRVIMRDNRRKPQDESPDDERRIPGRIWHSGLAF